MAVSCVKEIAAGQVMGSDSDPFREKRLGPIHTFDEMKVLARLPNLLLHDEKQS